MKSYQDFRTLIEKRIEHERNLKEHPPEEGELLPEGSIPTDYNMMDIDGDGLIHYAIKEGNIEAVKDLIENKNVALYRKDLHPLVREHLPFGSKTEIYLPKEAIIYAINSNQPEIAKYLIEQCQKKYGNDYICKLPIHQIIDKKNLDLFKPFLAKQMQHYKEEEVIRFNPEEETRASNVLLLASELGDETAIKTLMSKPCTMEFDPKTGAAIKKFNPYTGQPVVNVFDAIKNSSNVIIKNSCMNNNSDLFISFFNSHIKPLLIEPSAFVKESLTDMMSRSLELLLENNANPSLNIVNILLEYGADPNIDTMGVTILMLAAKIGNMELIEKLIKNGASIDRLDINGNNFLHFLTKDNIEKFEKLNLIEANKLNALKSKDNYFGHKPGDALQSIQIDQEHLLTKLYYYHIKTNRSLDSFDVNGICNGLSFAFQLDESPNKSAFYQKLRDISSWDGNTPMNLSGNIPKTPDWENFYSQVIFHQYSRGINQTGGTIILAGGDQRNRIHQLNLVGSEFDQIKNIMRYNNNKCSYNQLVELCKILYQLPNQAMVDLGGSRHGCAIVKVESGKFLFYDPNVSESFHSIDTPEKLAEVIYNEKLVRFNQSHKFIAADGTFDLEFNIHCMEKNYQAFLNDSKQFKQDMLTNNSDIEKLRFYLLTERYGDAISLIRKNDTLLNEKDTLGVDGAQYCLNSKNPMLIKAALKDKEITDTLGKQLNQIIFDDRNSAVLQTLTTEQLKSFLENRKDSIFQFSTGPNKQGFIDIVVDNVNYLLEHAKSGFIAMLVVNKGTKDFIFSSIQESQREPEVAKQALMATLQTEIDKVKKMAAESSLLSILNTKNVNDIIPAINNFISDSNNNVNFRDEKGVSLLMRAAKTGITGAVLMLIRSGADINQYDNENKNFLHYLPKEKIDDFIKYSANLDQPITSQIVKMKNEIDKNAQPQIANDDILPSKLPLPDKHADPKLSSNKSVFFRAASPARKIANDAVMAENDEKKILKR